MDIPLTNSQTQSFFKPTALLSSPLKDLNFYDTPQITQELKYMSTISPNAINHRYDWINLIPTPLNPHKLSFPNISEIQNKISLTNFAENSESILNDMSPFKSISSPNMEYKNVFDKEIVHEHGEYKHRRIGCFKNLTKHFENNNNANVNSGNNGTWMCSGIQLPKKVTMFNKPIEIVQHANENMNISNISYQFQQLKNLFPHKGNARPKSMSHYSISEFVKGDNCASYTLNTFNFGFSDNYKVNTFTVNNNHNNAHVNKTVAHNNTKAFCKQANSHSVVKCKCSKSQCLKLYCECFANGRTCNNCFCVGCCNTEENSSKRDAIYKKIILKNPKALIKIKSSKKSWTCKCKNSNCQKNYCECFQNGKACSTKCKCVDCRNRTVYANRRKNDKKALLQKKTKRRLSKVNMKSNRNSEANKYHDSSFKNDFIYTPVVKNYRNYNKSGISTNADTQKNKGAFSVKQEESVLKTYTNSSYKKLDLNIDESKIKNGLFFK